MQLYTVCLLICEKTNRVLLIKKNKTDFRGKYNGVGGKFEADETGEMCAIREIKEETGVDVEGRLVWLGTFHHPQDCVKHDPEGCLLYFYAASIEENEVHQPKGETEKLKWFDINHILAMPTYNDVLAGNGDLQFILNEAMMRLSE